MIDPMEGISSPNSGFNPSEALSSLGGNDGRDIFDGYALQGNSIKIDQIRSFMGILSGCVAGILGLTGLFGIGTWTFWGFQLRYGL
jgi:hypothetical protein